MISLPDQGGRLGKYDLVKGVAKSPLGPTWLARSTEPSQTAPVLVAVRRLMLGSTLAAGDKDLVAQAAVWALAETSEGALNSVDIVVTGHELGLVREHAVGQPLRALLRQCVLNAQAVPSGVVLRLALDVLETLSATTIQSNRLASGVALHCGLIGPDFLWITSDGRTLLTDIGVSAALRATSPFAGLADLVAYSAPEQLTGTLDDLRSDIFVLGVLLWELLSGGRRLFQGSDPSEVAASVTSARIVTPVSPGAPSSELDEATAAIVMRALERDLDQRFQGPEQMREAIAALTPGAVASRAEVLTLLTAVSGDELVLQEEAVQQALGQGSDEHATEVAAAPRPASVAPPKPVSAAAPSPSSPPSNPSLAPVSQPVASTPTLGLAGPVSAPPGSIPPQTDEVDSGWEEDDEAPAQPLTAESVAGTPASPASAPSAVASTASPSVTAGKVGTLASAAVTGPSEQAGLPSARVQSVASEPSGAPSAAPAKPKADAAPASTAASVSPAHSYGPVAVSQASAALSAEPRRRLRWQIGATAALLVLAGTFTVVGFIRRSGVGENKPVVAAEVRAPTVSASAAKPAGPPPPAVAPSASAETAPPAPAEDPARQARTEDAGSSGESAPSGDRPDAGAFAAAFAKHVSGSSVPTKTDSKKKTKATQQAKPAGSSASSDPLDVLRRLESKRREEKDSKTGGP